MFGWIYSHLLKFLSYLVAPIIFHTSRDSYVLLFIYTIMELADTFIAYRIFILFVTSGLLLRNYLFNPIKSSKILNKVTSKIQDFKNDLKGLILNSLTLYKPFTSNSLQFFKNFLKK